MHGVHTDGDPRGLRVGAGVDQHAGYLGASERPPGHRPVIPAQDVVAVGAALAHDDRGDEAITLDGGLRASI